VSLALLRKESDWISAKIETYTTKDEDEAEQKFSELSLKERWEIETLNPVPLLCSRSLASCPSRKGGRSKP
jgi:hypothetical protein